MSDVHVLFGVYLLILFILLSPLLSSPSPFHPLLSPLPSPPFPSSLPPRPPNCLESVGMAQRDIGGSQDYHSGRR